MITNRFFNGNSPYLTRPAYYQIIVLSTFFYILPLTLWSFLIFPRGPGSRVDMPLASPVIHRLHAQPRLCRPLCLSQPALSTLHHVNCLSVLLAFFQLLSYFPLQM